MRGGTTGVTEEVARFVTGLRYEQLPREVVGLAKRHMLDGLGVMLAGTVEEGTRLLQAHLVELGGPQEATVLGSRLRLPVPHAALLNGTSGHAMDYDDTQLSTSKESVYGLLTHPTVPVLAAALALGEKRRCSGQALLLAYATGVEVECRIADAIHPRHYQAGFHSTATMGGLGACAGAAVLLGLDSGRLRTALGIAASLSAGLRENFGTMTKPLHAGWAARNGVTAALLASRGFSADARVLEGESGFMRAGV
ncbi:MAG: MmgE/PrpD family protein [Deltaproteobacteria bacterium]|nr:MmgE/PrpD family protein [Deltaproteobacteria bacterium]